MHVWVWSDESLKWLYCFTDLLPSSRLLQKTDFSGRTLLFMILWDFRFSFFGPTFYHAFSLLVCLLSHFITIIWSWMNPLRLDCQLEKFPQIFAILFMLEVSKYLVSSFPWILCNFVPWVIFKDLVFSFPWIFAILWTPSSLWWSWFCCCSRWFSASALGFLLRILWCSQISVIVQKII